MHREMNFYNVVPVFPGHEDFAISEILRQHRDVGLDRFLISLSFHPQRTPARDLIPELCGRFAKVRDAVAASGEKIEMSILIQSILGHGWNGKVPLTGETWGHVVLNNGSVSPRFCILDEGFREYTREVVDAVARERPALILLDDDIGVRNGECFCPRHLESIARVLGHSVSREELDAAYKEGSMSPDVAVNVRRALADGICGYAAMIRETIDAVDPSMRCGICSCWAGQWQMHGLAKALAGGTRPLMRVNDAIYGDQKPSALALDYVCASRVRHRTALDAEYLDEADTFPQNTMSVSATVFHAHIASAMLNGLDGCKLWTSEFQNPGTVGSQWRYEARLRDYAGFYGALRDIAADVSWRGLAMPLFVPRDGIEGNPYDGSAGLFPSSSYELPETSYGIPFRCAETGEGGIFSIRGREAEWIGDDDIRRILSGIALVDAEAARILTGRGFCDLMGARATAGGDDFHFSSEELADGSLSLAMLWDSSASLLEPVSHGVEVLSWFCKGDFLKNPKRAFPAATLFKNRLGGRVAVLGWSFDMAWHKLKRPTRRTVLLHILDKLQGSPVEMVAETGENAFVRHGLMPDGREIAAVFHLGYDIDESLPLRLFRDPGRVEILNPDGKWRQIGFRRTSASTVDVEARLACAEPVVLRFAF